MTKLYPQIGDLNLAAADGGDPGAKKGRRGEDKQHSQTATSASVEAAIAAAQAAARVCWEGPHQHSWLFPLQVGLTEIQGDSLKP